MKLLGPSAVLGTTTFAEYVRRHAALRTVVTREEMLVAYVNGGRWVADCPNCAAGISLHRDWAAALCFGCGASYAAALVEWPDDFEAIEGELALRPLVNQNWFPHESLGDLKTERALAEQALQARKNERAARLLRE